MNRFIYSEGRFVAQIVQQNKSADYYDAANPWSLLHNTGRIDRFATLKEAREEARKAWPRVEIRTT